LICHTCSKQFDPTQLAVGKKYCSIGCSYWNGVDIEAAGCWIWKRKKTVEGYGIIKWKGQWFATHRVAYAVAHDLSDVGQVPTIYNTCGNKSCARGDHWSDNAKWKWAFSERFAGFRPRGKIKD
jgi:hypothetical protein